MLVDIDFITMAQKRLALINSQNMEDITWIKDGKVVTFSKEELEQFKFMGLCNIDILAIFKYKV